MRNQASELDAFSRVCHRGGQSRAERQAQQKKQISHCLRDFYHEPPREGTRPTTCRPGPPTRRFMVPMRAKFGVGAFPEPPPSCVKSPRSRHRASGGFSCFVSCVLLSLFFATHVNAAESQVEELHKQAQAAFDRKENDKALALAQKAIEADPKNPQSYYFRGNLHDALKQYQKAVADYDEVLKLNRNTKRVYQLRGVAHFKLGHIQESIADFDQFIKLEPAQAPYHWQRGIAYYYAGRYVEGRKQFELHQTVNASDVENAVWHFLCVARSDGVKKAGESLIKIGRDSRVPMMEVYALFAGKGSAEDVLAAAKAKDPAPEELKQRLFFAHLYLGLYYEALGDNKRAKEHILKSVDEYPAEHYMGDVARVHAKLRWEEWMKN